MTRPSIVDDYQAIRTRAQELERAKKAALMWCRNTALTFIVIREDNNLTANLIGDLLEAHGCQVFVTWDDDEALEIARLHKPDLIQSDMQGVKHSGLEFARMVRRDERLQDVPLLCATAFAKESDRQFILDAGLFNGYLPKPINLRLYFRLIADLLKKPGFGFAC